MMDRTHLGRFEEDALLLLVASPRPARILLEGECTLEITQLLLRLLNQRRIRLLILQVPEQGLLLCDLLLQRDRRARARHSSSAVPEVCAGARWLCEL